MSKNQALHKLNYTPNLDSDMNTRTHAHTHTSRWTQEFWKVRNILDIICRLYACKCSYLEAFWFKIPITLLGSTYKARLEFLWENTSYVLSQHKQLQILIMTYFNSVWVSKSINTTLSLLRNWTGVAVNN